MEIPQQAGGDRLLGRGRVVSYGEVRKVAAPWSPQQVPLAVSLGPLHT